MNHGLEIFYQCFSGMVFCIAVLLLFYTSNLIIKMEQNVDRSMYKQHVISCEVARS